MPHERGHDTRMPIGFLSHSPFANHVAHELSWSSQTGEQESPQLSPQLRSEVTRYVLSETLGKLPIFADLFDTELQLELFPYVRPVSYERGETIFRKGELARELMFLLSGEIHMMHPVDNKVAVIMTKGEQTVLRQDAPTPLATFKHRGAFGETVLTGMRRRLTTVAHTNVETLIIDRPDLIKLFKQSDNVDLRQPTSDRTRHL